MKYKNIKDLVYHHQQTGTSMFVFNLITNIEFYMLFLSIFYICCNVAVVQSLELYVVSSFLKRTSQHNKQYRVLLNAGTM